MDLDRRQFIVLTTAAVAGCNAGSTLGPGASVVGQSVDAGPIDNYSADGVYGAFRDRGFFLIRSGGKLRALSSICTHRACALTPASDRSFFCKCHGSTFDPDGRVTKGPARRDLPAYQVMINEQGHVIVGPSTAV